MTPENEGKLYYSISEVAEITDLEPYVLRFWEKEFSQLRPKKNRAGNRTYQLKDIDIINRIKTLLYSDGYTIDGARKVLKENKQLGKDAGLSKKQMEKLLFGIKAELEELMKLFS
ncbi:MAG: MerR family transcriptional regulator [candidate division Zixibacteria bacterium]|nr:MerR family transcriptional regulator [candidate division Zixibacteria bacterium]